MLHILLLEESVVSDFLQNIKHPKPVTVDREDPMGITY